MYKRIFLIVLDSLGVGALPDANLYGDTNANTLKNLSFSKKDFNIPNLFKLGIGILTDVNNAPISNKPSAAFGKMNEASVGKDTLTGHWEIMGIKTSEPFKVFDESGFPKQLINMIEELSGFKLIGNYAASGTEIIKELGEEHINTKKAIIYTSADSVLQIAAHEEVFGLDNLYKLCEISRKITLENPEWKVGRVIARPFLGETKESFFRTSNRKDYSISPPYKTTMDILKENNYDVISIGKISDIFNEHGITKKYKTKSNDDGMNKLIETQQEKFTGLCFINLVDFDAIFGHRRNALGYAIALEEFDKKLCKVLNNLENDDLVIITADHGNDPLHSGTDHTREYVPLLVYGHKVKNISLGVRETFADIAATISDNFGVSRPKNGKSFLENINK